MRGRDAVVEVTRDGFEKVSTPVHLDRAAQSILVTLRPIAIVTPSEDAGAPTASATPQATTPAAEPAETSSAAIPEARENGKPSKKAGKQTGRAGRAQPAPGTGTSGGFNPDDVAE